MRVAFGGVHAVDGVTVDLFPGEVVALVGGNGAGKTTLIKTLSGAHPADSGEIRIEGKPVTIANPRDAKVYGIETIYQTLALADNVDATANMFLGRELKTRWGSLDEAAMEDATRKIMGRLNPKFLNFKTAVNSLSGGQRQSVAIARAVHFNARILIMDEPTAALGPAETAQVAELIKQLKAEGIGIFLISHDIHDVFDLADRISVMLQGKLVGTVNKTDVTMDEVLGMIIIGKLPHEVSQTELEKLHEIPSLQGGEVSSNGRDRGGSSQARRSPARADPHPLRFRSGTSPFHGEAGQSASLMLRIDQSRVRMVRGCLSTVTTASATSSGRSMSARPGMSGVRPAPIANSVAVPPGQMVLTRMFFARSSRSSPPARPT